MQSSEIQKLIETGLPGCTVEVDGDGTHFAAMVVSEAFDGKNMVQRHQLVYSTLGQRMGGDIHALSIQAHTPAEWEQKKALRVL